MADVRELTDELAEVQTINMISGVMSDIAAQRMEELRDQFQRNRMYYDEVQALFTLIRRLMRARFDMDRENTTNRALAIAVTSNYRFFGGLNREVAELFLDRFDQYDDHIVVGDTGAQHVQGSTHAEDSEYMRFPEDAPSHQELWRLVQRFRSYDRVDVYYPRYKNPFQQQATAVDVNAMPEQEFKDDPETFITEPNLPLLHDFFLTQVKWLIFKRVLLETDLSRMSARLMKMHSAEETSEDMQEQLQGQIRRSRQQQRDVQLFESIIGLQQWRALHENT